MFINLNIRLFGDRLMVGLQVLVLAIWVRILVPEPYLTKRTLFHHPKENFPLWWWGHRENDVWDYDVNELYFVINFKNINKKITTLVLILIIIGAGAITVFNLYGHGQEKKNTIISALMIKLTPEEIVNQSDGIIIGTVKDLQTAKVPSSFRSGKEDIVTNAVISVEKYLFNPKNLPLPDITVQTVGGTIGKESMTMEDSPVFEKGQRVIVFLRQEKDNTLTVFGGSQGKYTINNGSVADGAQEQEIFNSVFGKQMTLDELEKNINSIASSPAPQK